MITVFHYLGVTEKLDLHLTTQQLLLFTVVWDYAES